MSDFDPERVLETLHQNRVDFVLVGGLAAVIHGSTLVTADVDITPERSTENLVRLATALRELNARLRTANEPDGVPFPIDAAFLANQPHLVNLVTDAGDVGLAFTPSGFADGYRAIRPDAIYFSLVAGTDTLVAALNTVIVSKRAADRDKDRAALPYLEALEAELSNDTG